MGASPRSLFAIFCVAITLTGSEAFAAGLELPGTGTRALARGGAFTALADDLTAIAHNPGALIKLRGTSVLLTNNFFLKDERFTRAETLLEEDRFANAELYGISPLEEVRNESDFFPLGPVLAAGSDFGLENFVFAFGVYGPNSPGSAKWPVDGGQRYMLTEQDALLFYLTSSMAYGVRDVFGIGLSAQVVMAPQMRLQLVIDGSPNSTQTLNPYASSNDVESIVEVQDNFTFSAILGAWWRPVESFEIALSGRVIPINIDAKGDFSLRNVPNQTQFTDPRLEVSDSSARLQFSIAPTARLGLRYRYLEDTVERFDIELDLVYEAWSTMDATHLELNGVINLFGGDKETPDALVDRQWSDTLSVRLGGSVNFADWATFSTGAYYETGAVPSNYEHVDFFSFDRVGLGLGFGGDFDVFRFMVAYMHVFQEPRSVSEAFGKVFQQRPLSPCPDECLTGETGVSGVPVNAGTFKSSYDIFSLSLEANF